MVFMPPRHGKSELISKYFPAWYLGKHPDHRVILASYEADFAATWGKHARDILSQHHSTFNIQIDDASAARNRWDIQNHNGGMVTAGVGGPITGKGADILIIDDPVKNAEQANSPTYREKALDWYNSTAYTRLEPDGAIILIMTRWHEDDLAGKLLKQDNEDWTILKLPAINKDGEALWPERYGLKELNRIKKQIGGYWFNAMYQQTPQPSEGGLLKREWLQYHQHPMNGDYGSFDIYQGWDLAISEKESADYTVCCTLGRHRHDNNLYLLDIYRAHIDFPTQVSKVIEYIQKYKPLVIGIEDVAYQRALPQQVLSQEILPIKPIKRVGDKVTRIIGISPFFENGMIKVPGTHMELDNFRDEYLHFPRGRHDDILDALEIAVNLARTGSSEAYTPGKHYYDYSHKGLQNQYKHGRRQIKP
jgi:predicted phage terminase large subunit-like protein